MSVREIPLFATAGLWQCCHKTSVKKKKNPLYWHSRLLPCVPNTSKDRSKKKKLMRLEDWLHGHLSFKCFFLKQQKKTKREKKIVSLICNDKNASAVKTTIYWHRALTNVFSTRIVHQKCTSVFANKQLTIWSETLDNVNTLDNFLFNW